MYIVILTHRGNQMELQYAFDVGRDDGLYGWVACPYDGWDNAAETLAYMRGYYAGKYLRKLLG